MYLMGSVLEPMATRPSDLETGFSTTGLGAVVSFLDLADAFDWEMRMCLILSKVDVIFGFATTLDFGFSEEGVVAFGATGMLGSAWGRDCDNDASSVFVSGVETVALFGLSDKGINFCSELSETFSGGVLVADLLEGSGG